MHNCIYIFTATSTRTGSKREKATDRSRLAMQLRSCESVVGVCKNLQDLTGKALANCAGGSSGVMGTRCTQEMHACCHFSALPQAAMDELMVNASGIATTYRELNCTTTCSCSPCMSTTPFLLIASGCIRAKLALHKQVRDP